MCGTSQKTDRGMLRPAACAVDLGEKLPFVSARERHEGASPEVSGVSGRKRPLIRANCSKSRPAEFIPLSGPNFCPHEVFDERVKIARGKAETPVRPSGLPRRGRTGQLQLSFHG